MGRSFILILFIFLSCCELSFSLPLSTNGRWIIDEATGQRVKLRCVNWVSHAQPMLAEGLDKRPLKDIVGEIARRQYNCVRLTYATHTFTRYANQTIGDSFDNLDIKVAKAGLTTNNPSFLNKTVVEAYEAVIDELAVQGIMIHIDNHISQPRWCCSLDDGNGFFGDRHFDPKEWLKGLAFVARRFSQKHKVISMSLRNEIRGTEENDRDWHHYVRKATRVIHRINPKLLVVVSGLNYDNDLSFLKERPLGSNLDNKLVYEVHLYGFSGDPESKWLEQPLNSICNKIIQGFENNAGFLIRGENPFPLFVSEFGYDQRGTNEGDNRYMSCFLPYLAENDVEWAFWAFQGSYYFRQGNQQTEETYGIMDVNWQNDRDPSLASKLQLIQRMNQDPNSNMSTSSIMYHTPSGQCVTLNKHDEIELDNCTYLTRWSHDGAGAPIRLMESAKCLKAVGEELPPILSDDCLSKQSAWISASKSKLHLAARDEKGQYLCLEKKSPCSSSIVTRKCICIEDDPDCLDDPQSQWFKLISTNTM